LDLAEKDGDDKFKDLFADGEQGLFVTEGGEVVGVGEHVEEILDARFGLDDDMEVIQGDDANVVTGGEQVAIANQGALDGQVGFEVVAQDGDVGRGKSIGLDSFVLL
jgi:hypothetical protein